LDNCRDRGGSGDWRRSVSDNGALRHPDCDDSASRSATRRTLPQKKKFISHLASVAALVSISYFFMVESVETRFHLWKNHTLQNSITIAPHHVTDPLAAESSPIILPFPSFILHSGLIDSDGEPTTNARLCAKNTNECFTLLCSKEASKASFSFGLDPKAERITMPEGGSLVFFSATFSGGGSGILDSLALLKYGRDGKISDLLSGVYLTEQSDRRIWILPQLSNMPVLATADYIWGNGESHFASHFFTVSLYVFDVNTQQYVKQITYVTGHKYPSLDERRSIQVLQSERATIVARLAGQQT
jgi:hypothetical protein